MSHSQTQEAARVFIERWKGRGYEKGESQQFWMDLLQNVLGVPNPVDIISFENQVKLANTSFIDAYIAPTKVLIEQKGLNVDLRKAIKQSDGSLLSPFQQAKRYAAELPVSKHPRWVVTCNFKSFLVYDMENPHGEPEEILLENLEKEYFRLRFLVEDGKAHLQRELEVSIKAGELIGKLYDAFLKQYEETGTIPQSTSQKGQGAKVGGITDADLHSLNVLCVRLVFCLYAEDAGIFSKDQFYHYLIQYKPEQMRSALKALFTTLDTKIEERDRFLEESLAAFPYVNGSLFHQQPNEDIPRFNEQIADLLLPKASLGFDWSEISPTIFGAVFESTLNPETRRSGGMHYTSIENIHKVIDPLFLNDLKAEFEQIKEEKQDNKRKQKLDAFQDKLACLTFLDPACGSGNFLTETYISLRRLENELITLKYHGQKMLGIEQFNPIKVNIHQFYGIEINDFAVTVATTALWIAEAQMMHETERIIKFDLDYLPLKAFNNIHCGNALRMDWNDLIFASPQPLSKGEGLRNPGYMTSDAKMWGDLKERSREHRKEPTQAEDCLWQALRNSKLGYKFRRQHPIHVYIADFICLDKKLIVEVDGGYHDDANQQYLDEQRTRDLQSLGFSVIRFTNEEVLYHLNEVVEKIKICLASPQPLSEGEGLKTTSPSPLERGQGGEARFDYIMGNPPFVGATMMTADQKQDAIAIFEKGKRINSIDYVGAWYYKAALMMQSEPDIHAAFVSTNSITQGEQVSPFWGKLLTDYSIHIDFAYRTFKWNSEAKEKAAVHCVIIGFSTDRTNRDKTIYFNDSSSHHAKNINPYLVDAPDVIIESRNKSICAVPAISYGNKPADGGNLILSQEERDKLIQSDTALLPYIRRYVGARDFINNDEVRYCLWLKDASPALYYKNKEIMQRLQAVKEMRAKSTAAPTRAFADKPHLFFSTPQKDSTYLCIPEVSSERRRYIPIGFLDSATIAANTVVIVPDATLYHFGVITSNVHMAWMRTVAGRLKSDYRYAGSVVYNNFPWPTPTDAQKAKIEQTAQAILDARALHSDCSLAILYDEVTMPPELRKAHQNNDRAVMEAYGFDWRTMTESECVAELFKLYQQLVEREKKDEGEKKGKGKRGNNCIILRMGNINE